MGGEGGGRALSASSCQPRGRLQRHERYWSSAMTETLEALGTCIAHGADPSEPDASGRTPCTGPGDRDDPAMATVLLEAGADSAAAGAVVRVEVGRMPDGPSP